MGIAGCVIAGNGVLRGGIRRIRVIRGTSLCILYLLYGIWYLRSPIVGVREKRARTRGARGGRKIKIANILY